MSDNIQLERQKQLDSEDLPGYLMTSKEAADRLGLPTTRALTDRIGSEFELGFHVYDIREPERKRPNYRWDFVKLMKYFKTPVECRSQSKT